MEADINLLTYFYGPFSSKPRLMKPEGSRIHHMKLPAIEIPPRLRAESAQSPLDAACFDTTEDGASLCSSTLRFARCAGRAQD